MGNGFACGRNVTIVPRGLLVPLLFVVGIAVGTVTAFTQAHRFVIGTVVLPWGVVVSLIIVLIVIRGATWLSMSRVGGWMVFIGWLVATVALSLETPSGDVAISGGNRQLAYLIIGAVAGAAAAALPLPVNSTNVDDVDVS